MSAKEELLEELKELPQILCAQIKIGCEWYDKQQETFNLTKFYTPSDYDEFMKFLDRDYDSGFGSQELFGIVWLIDGTWLERREYDGSEWWEHKVCPEIPDELK